MNRSAFGKKAVAPLLQCLREVWLCLVLRPSARLAGLQPKHVDKLAMACVGGWLLFLFLTYPLGNNMRIRATVPDLVACQPGTLRLEMMAGWGAADEGGGNAQIYRA